jgi:DNA polymerase-3 subunit delta
MLTQDTNFTPMPKSAIALLGDDLVRLRDAVADCVTKHVDEVFRAFNHQQFGPGEASPAAIEDAVSAFPFGGGRRVVVVRELAAFPESQQEDVARLAERLASRSGGASTLIVAAPGLDRRKRPWKILSALGKLPEGECRVFESPKPWQVDDWVAGRAAERGIRLGRGVAQALSDLIGEDLLALDGELTKLLLYTGSDRPISEADVEAVSGRSRGEMPWELPRLLLAGDAAGSERLLERLLAAGEKPVFLVQVLTRGILEVWRARLLLDEGRSPQEAARELGMKEYVARRTLPLARRNPDEALGAMLAALKHCDRELKRRSGQAAELLQEAVGRIALIGSAAAPGTSR